MRRREFLKTTLLLSVNFGNSGLKLLGQINNKQPADNYFKFLEIEGNYREIGFKIGRFFKYNFYEIIKRRTDWYSNLRVLAESKKGQAISNELKRITIKYFPQYIEELEGIAAGTGMDFNFIWAMSIKSELMVLEKENPGCSTIVSLRNNKKWVFHNEDGHRAFDNLMFLVKVKPPSGVEFISLVYPGILMGNGPSLNKKGIVQTTNYISSTQIETGIPRYLIGRAILEASSLDEAQQIATMSPRTYPYHHNLASFENKKYISVETIPGKYKVTEPEGIYFHTNHLIHPDTNLFKFEDSEYRQTSSISRYKVIKGNIDQKEQSPDEFLSILSSHEHSPYSPCRHPMGNVNGKTLGTAFYDLDKGIFQLYFGNPCEAVKGGKYKKLNLK